MIIVLANKQLINNIVLKTTEFTPLRIKDTRKHEKLLMKSRMQIIYCLLDADAQDNRYNNQFN